MTGKRVKMHNNQQFHLPTLHLTSFTQQLFVLLVFFPFLELSLSFSYYRARFLSFHQDGHYYYSHYRYFWLKYTSAIWLLMVI